jgi:hypothetical protein
MLAPIQNASLGSGGVCCAPTACLPAIRRCLLPGIRRSPCKKPRPSPRRHPASSPSMLDRVGKPPRCPPARATTTASGCSALINDPKRGWLTEPQSATEYANGARFFAYRVLRRALSCRELILASQDLTIAAARRSAPGSAVFGRAGGRRAFALDGGRRRVAQRNYRPLLILGSIALPLGNKDY